MSPELLCHGDLDERALDALKEFPAEGGLAVLNEFKESNLKHVGNKSAYLCGVMKTYRHKNKLMAGHDLTQKRGPDEAKIKVRLGGRDTDVPEYKMFLPSVKQVASQPRACGLVCCRCRVGTVGRGWWYTGTSMADVLLLLSGDSRPDRLHVGRDDGSEEVRGAPAELGRRPARPWPRGTPYLNVHLATPIYGQ